MCIWKVGAEDRLCEYCSYLGGCEMRLPEPIRDVEVRKSLASYGAIMAEIVGSKIFVKSRNRTIVWCRYMIAYQLNLDGFSWMAIGRAMGKDHSTIIYGARHITEMLSYPKMYSVETEIWNRFQESLSLQKR